MYNVRWVWRCRRRANDNVRFLFDFVQRLSPPFGFILFVASDSRCWHCRCYFCCCRLNYIYCRLANKSAVSDFCSLSSFFCPFLRSSAMNAPRVAYFHTDGRTLSIASRKCSCRLLRFSLRFYWKMISFASAKCNNKRARVRERTRDYRFFWFASHCTVLKTRWPWQLPCNLRCRKFELKFVSTMRRYWTARDANEAIRNETMRMEPNDERIEWTVVVVRSLCVHSLAGVAGMLPLLSLSVARSLAGWRRQA